MEIKVPIKCSTVKKTVKNIEAIFEVIAWLIALMGLIVAVAFLCGALSSLAWFTILICTGTSIESYSLTNPVFICSAVTGGILTTIALFVEHLDIEFKCIPDKQDCDENSQEDARRGRQKDE